ncbi:helix-turn-helix transcriptional regulator [Phenylobacterium sp.]|jgi:predicted DNA-binding transcriptional regulator YafY|uniref:helix-turn-helix transcriptional regulator n=1 Tax=Phenylobacterium sp. TaxID=1871053 RepID=UPI002F420648
MQASRLLSILLLLQTRGRMTAQALAEEFEVSIRTIYRDVDQLSAAGVPVYADRGRTGGFQLLDGYRTKLTGLTAAEAEALFLSGLPGPAADLGLGEAMAQAQLKLLAALPARGEQPRLGARFHLDPIGWFRGAEPIAILPQLAEAVWGSRIIRIRYESWTDTVDRELQPLGLTLKAGVWYLVAAASENGIGGKPRTYRVSAIEALALTEQAFERPVGFDLPAYWNAWAADFEARIQRGQAVLRLSPEGLRRLPRLSAAAKAMAEETAGPPDAQGWVTVTIPIEIDSLDHAADEILKLGPHAELLGPPDLRAHMAHIVEEMKGLYGPTDAARGAKGRSGPASPA